MKIQEGERVKLWYGYAWQNYDSLTFEVFIIPFNFIFRWIRTLCIKCRQSKATQIDSAFEKGYELGKKEAEEKHKAKFAEIGEQFLEVMAKRKP